MHICHKKLGVFFTKWTELFSYLYMVKVLQLYSYFSVFLTFLNPVCLEKITLIVNEYRVCPSRSDPPPVEKKSCAIKKLHETIGLFRPRKWRILPQWLRTKRGQFRNISIELILSSANGGHNTGQQSQFAEWYMQEHLHPKWSCFFLKNHLKVFTFFILLLNITLSWCGTILNCLHVIDLF